jgi:hypothetical protein
MKVRAESVWRRARRPKIGVVVAAGVMVLSAISMVLGGGAGTFW